MQIFWWKDESKSRNVMTHFFQDLVRLKRRELTELIETKSNLTHQLACKSEDVDWINILEEKGYAAIKNMDGVEKLIYN